MTEPVYLITESQIKLICQEFENAYENKISFFLEDEQLKFSEGQNKILTLVHLQLVNQIPIMLIEDDCICETDDEEEETSKEKVVKNCSNNSLEAFEAKREQDYNNCHNGYTGEEQ